MHPLRSISFLLSAAGSVSTVRMHGAVRAAASDARRLDVVSVVSKVMSGQNHMQVADVLNFGNNALSVLMARNIREEECGWFCKFLERAEDNPLNVALIGVKLYNVYSSIFEYVADIEAAEYDETTGSDWNKGIINLNAVFVSSLWSAFESGAAKTWLDSQDGIDAKNAWILGWNDQEPLKQAFRDLEAGNSDKAFQPVLKQGADTLVASLKVGAPLHVDLWETLDTSLGGAIDGWENIVDEKWALALGDVWTAFYSLYDNLGDLWPIDGAADRICRTDGDPGVDIGSRRGCEKKAKDGNKQFYQFKERNGANAAKCAVCDNADSATTLAGWSIYKKPAEESEASKRLGQLDTIISKLKTTIEDYENRKAKICDQTDTGGHCICTRKTVERKQQEVSQCFHGFTFDQSRKVCIPVATNGADCEEKCQPGGNLDKACPEFCPANKRYCCKKGAGPVACRRAIYVELDFATGSASDYYQCVSPAVDVGDDSAELFEEPLQAGAMVQQAAPQESSSLLLQRASLGAGGAHSSSISSLDRATARKGGDSKPVALPNGAAKAACDPDSVFKEAIEGNDGKCFESCPSGYAPVSTDDETPKLTTNCKQSCGTLSAEATFGIIPVDGVADALEWDVCGITEPFVNTAKSDSVGVMDTLIREIVSAIDKITKNNDLTQVELEKLADEVAKAFDHFAHPECGKEYEAPTAAPTPAPAR